MKFTMKTGYVAMIDRLQWGTVETGRVFSVCLAVLLALPMPSQAAPLAPQASNSRTILVMGDSLSAAYGLTVDQGWVALITSDIAEQKPGWRVVNASISGETTAGGAARIVSAVVQHRPAVVVIELGANDALRGLPLRETRRNLARMIGAAQGVGAKVLLLDMRIPPNYGREYTAEFEQSYTDVSKRFNTALDPFFLAPIAAHRSNFQADNLHPTAAAQPLIADHVWSSLAPMLD